MVGPVRPVIVLFGSSVVLYSSGDGGWGANLADHYSRKADVVLQGYEGWNSRQVLQVVATVFPQDKSWVTVPEFGEWDKRKGVFMRDYSGHFAMMRSVRRYRKKLLSWTSIGNGDELVEQSSKPVKHPEHYRHVSDYDAPGNSRQFNNRTRKSPAIGGFMRYFFCCFYR